MPANQPNVNWRTVPGRSRSNLDNEDDEDGFIKDSTLAPYIRNIIKQIDDQRRATAFKQLTLF